ncbi:MAG: GrpB family protein [Candidatus Dormibacteraeota bacterium]|nr:GrpB family protein [Candidatus Dormibacteraeota bacterium]
MVGPDPVPARARGHESTPGPPLRLRADHAGSRPGAGHPEPTAVAAATPAWTSCYIRAVTDPTSGQLRWAAPQLADPFATWCRLRGELGPRVTVIDLYQLVAAGRGLRAEELTRSERELLSERALDFVWPHREIEPGSDRVHEPILVTAYDPGWPDLFVGWRARLSAALGASARRIDHIGSTAVPGLDAKPVIDIQVSVDRIEDEASYRPGLEGCHLRMRSRDDLHRYFRPALGRPRKVQVHVCQVGGAWERDHLLLRDFLRASETARVSYAGTKRAAAARWRDDRIAYTEAKTAVILDTLEAAEAWASSCGWSVIGPSI